MSMRIIIAGGGTGGHIFPAVAIARALLSLDEHTELLFVGALGRMEMEKIPLEGFKIIGLDIAGFNRSNLLKNLSLPLKLLRSAAKAKAILKDFKPDVVVGVGGYASFPMLNAAQGKGLPTLIQEQNSYAGKSNKMLSKKANTICVAYDGMEKFFPLQKLLLTGNPVRKTISKSKLTRTEGLQYMGMDTDATTLLVVGGSLGAQSINEAIDAGLATLVQSGLQVIWQTGKNYFEQAQKSAAAYGKKVKVFDFIREMEFGYAAADVIISRAGALAIAELCIVAKPVLFVPYPFAAEDHQTSNAAALVAHGAAEMVRNSDAKNDLIPKVLLLVKDEAARKMMHRNLKDMAIDDADDRIAKQISHLAKAQSNPL